MSYLILIAMKYLFWGLHYCEGLCACCAAGRGVQQHGSVLRKYDALPHAARFLQKELWHVLVPSLQAINVDSFSDSVQ